MLLVGVDEAASIAVNADHAASFTHRAETLRLSAVAGKFVKVLTEHED
jgi:hypothetical protein